MNKHMTITLSKGISITDLMSTGMFKGYRQIGPNKYKVW